MCYINQKFSVKIVMSYKFPASPEVLPIEITLGKRKILLLQLYRPPILFWEWRFISFRKCVKSLQ